MRHPPFCIGKVGWCHAGVRATTRTSQAVLFGWHPLVCGQVYCTRVCLSYNYIQNVIHGSKNMWCRRAIERSLDGRPCHDGLPEKLGVTPCPPLADLSTDTMGGEDSEDPQEPNSAPREAAARSTAVKAGGAAAACVVVLLVVFVAFSGGDEDESGEGAADAVTIGAVLSSVAAPEFARGIRNESCAASGPGLALTFATYWNDSNIGSCLDAVQTCAGAT